MIFQNIWLDGILYFRKENLKFSDNRRMSENFARIGETFDEKSCWFLGESVWRGAMECQSDRPRQALSKFPYDYKNRLRCSRERAWQLGLPSCPSNPYPSMVRRWRRPVQERIHTTLQLRKFRPDHCPFCRARSRLYWSRVLRGNIHFAAFFNSTRLPHVFPCAPFESLQTP